jgi:hypothetical protein
MKPEDPSAAVDAAVAGTDALEEIPLAEHVARFDAVHVALNDALSRIDTD